jgi:16S rRNA (cytosine967-C5)-methyltransferase
MPMANNAREVALLALCACQRQGAWSDGFLKKAIGQAGLDSRDAALATRICFGVLQNRMLLDFYLAGLCTVKLEKLELPVLTSLRLGAYQILFLERVPHRAAVNESVELARKHARNPRAAGLVNGVLRSLIRALETLEPPEDLSVRYSHPAWLTQAFLDRLGADGARALLEADNGQPPTCVQVNTLRWDVQAVRTALEGEGVTVEAHPWLPTCLHLTGTGSLEQLESFQQGMFYVQDTAARLAVLAAQAQPGMAVLDACAAPGGKSFSAAVDMGDTGSIFSCDIHPHKEKLIQAGAARLGIQSIQTAVLDAKTRQEDLVGRFDRVIADVPCSGLGIIRKKPDIRYKPPQPLENLPAVQRAILNNVAGYVRPGGVLLYATCTLLQRENEDVVRSFLDKESDFTLEPFQLPGPIGAVDGMITLWPHIHETDGFFFARLRRRV